MKAVYGHTTLHAPDLVRDEGLRDINNVPRITMGGNERLDEKQPLSDTTALPLPMVSHT